MTAATIATLGPPTVIDGVPIPAAVVGELALPAELYRDISWTGIDQFTAWVLPRRHPGAVRILADTPPWATLRLRYAVGRRIVCEVVRVAGDCGWDRRGRLWVEPVMLGAMLSADG